MAVMPGLASIDSFIFINSSIFLMDRVDQTVFENPWLFTLVVIILFAFAAISVVLALVILRMKQMEKDLVEKNSELQYMVDHDFMTDLYSREYLEHNLQEALLDSKLHMLGLYSLEIVNHKVINDTYGHEIGDRVLVHVAKLIHKEFQSEDECVGIHRGEMYIMDGTVKNLDEMRSRLLHILRILSHPMLADYMEVDIKINIGVAVAPKDSIDAKMLIKKSNIALLEAVKLGPNRYHIFEDGLYKNILKRMTMEKQMRRALYMDEFVLHYQPRINLDTMKVNGCEALIRWQHPDGHLVYPNFFIPLAEEVGFIEEISEWVIKAVATQVKEWEDKGLNIKASFNISGKEFDDEFIEKFKRIINEVNANPLYLEVEITETAALKDLQHSKHLVEKLGNMGVTVSLDDFGTGYSSMTYIKKLKASKLKIDKSFIDQLEDYEQKVIVDSMIQLGRKLDYQINVEGVESEAQLRMLTTMNVDEIQGWLFSKAISAQDFVEFAQNFDGSHYLKMQDIS